MKKIYFVILFLGIFSYNAYSQNNEYESNKIEVANFLIKYCTFNDANPTRQEEIDSINFFMRKVLEKKYSSDKIPDLINQALHLLYDNSISMFEDSYDIFRMGTRRYLCFIALACLSDEWRYEIFIEDARACLRESDELYENKCILNMVEVYKILCYYEKAPHHKATLLLDDLKNMQKYITDKDFITEYSKILSKLIK